MHAITLTESGADGRVRAFYFVVERLANVMQKATRFGDIHIGLELGGQHAGDMRGLDNMRVLVLP